MRWGRMLSLAVVVAASAGFPAAKADVGPNVAGGTASGGYSSELSELWLDFSLTGVVNGTSSTATYLCDSLGAPAGDLTCSGTATGGLPPSITITGVQYQSPNPQPVGLLNLSGSTLGATLVCTGVVKDQRQGAGGQYFTDQFQGECTLESAV